MKSILFDVDGVLADFCYGFTKEAGVVPWSHTAQQTWQFPEDKIPLELRAATWEKVTTTNNWWCALPAMASGIAFNWISNMDTHNHMVFGTNRKGTPNAQYQTKRWLERKGIAHPNVVLTKFKGELAKVMKADYAIDDSPENAACIHWLSDETKSYIIDRPYNRVSFLPKRVRRVSSVEEFLEDIRKGA